MQFISLAILTKRIKAIKFMMLDKSVPKRKKALIIGGLLYLCMPFDLIPIIVPVFGLFDDLILWAWILFYLKDELDAYWKEEEPNKAAASDAKKRYQGKTIIDEVDYRVVDEDQTKTNHTDSGEAGGRNEEKDI